MHDSEVEDDGTALQKVSTGNVRTITRNVIELIPALIGHHRQTKAMDRTTMLNHLEQWRHIAEGERHIDQQREIVPEKERDGHDMSMSR